MDCVVEFEELDFEILEFDNLEIPEPQLRLRKRYVRDARNPFEWWSEEEFINRYRFTKDAVMNFLLPEIEGNFICNNRRGLPISPLIQLLVCLRFYASASFQIVCAELYGISQGSVCNIVKRVSEYIAQKREVYVKFPHNLQNQKRLFQEKGRVGETPGIPGVIGAIDCTHIRIVNTPNQQHLESFRNRKSFFSLNIQVVAGPRGEFCDIVARWAGSMHDSRIFQMSRLHTRLVQQELDGILLGDNGYPCLPFLFTPVLNPEGQGQILYNRAHVRTRNVVECAFGRWKRRFPCLSRGLGNKLETVANIVVACAVLYNMSLNIRDNLEFVEDDLPDNYIPVEQVRPRPGEGMAARQRVIMAHFS